MKNVLSTMAALYITIAVFKKISRLGKIILFLALAHVAGMYLLIIILIWRL